MRVSPQIAVIFTTLVTTTSAFTPSSLLAFHNKNGFAPNALHRKSPMKMVMPGHEDVLNNLDSLHTTMQTVHDHINMHLDLHSSVLLSDAADAVADATPADDGGWWKTYLNIFKSGLVLVHSTVDEPLRNMGLSQTWGPSIAIFTLGVRSLLLPISVQQAKSTEKIKALKPYQDQIKEKFKDNKDMMNRATAKLFEDTGANPLTGCFISLSQIPIFLGLYRSITLLARDGKIDEPFLWIPSLQGPVTAPDFRGMQWLTEGWTFDGSFPVPELGWATTLAFAAMPVALVLQQSLNLKILSPETDTDAMSDEEREQFEKTQGILKFLPLMIGYFSLQVPAGLTIYWFTSNLFTVSQALAVRAYYKANPPEIELPDYWDALDDVAAMSPEERRQAAEAGIPTGPSFDDLLDEAKFHYVVERNPLREQSAAWQRVQSTEMKIPTEFASWVGQEAPSPASSPKTEDAVAETANVD